MKSAAVLGSGVAALCAAHMLARHGWSVAVHGSGASNGPRLVLNATTVRLVKELFGEDVARWPETYVLAGRRTRWDDGAGERYVDEPAAVVSSETLCRRLRERVVRTTDRVSFVAAGAQEAAEPFAGGRWVVSARGRIAAGDSRYRQWLQRSVLTAEVPCEEMLSCAVMEATPAGWAFLFPHARGTATLQAMVANVSSNPDAQLAAMLAATKLIAPLLSEIPPARTILRAAPRLHEDLCRPGWIAVGDEAISLDPLCGDGTGYALREALLASGVARSVEDGLPADVALGHYRARLRSAAAAHLGACLAFYRTARFDPSWAPELAAMERGRLELERSLEERPPAALQMRGFDLVRSQPIAGE